jgi:hypothetical protein
MGLLTIDNPSAGMAGSIPSKSVWPESETGWRRRNPGLFEIHVEQMRIDEAIRRMARPGWNCVAVGRQAETNRNQWRQLAPAGRHIGIDLARETTPGIEQFLEKVGKRAFELAEAFPNLDCSLMRIEAEGAEELVLRGARTMIARSRPVILFESTLEGARRLGLRREDLFSLLYDEMRYEIFLSRDVLREGRALDLVGFEKAALYPYQAFHFFAIPREQCSGWRWASPNAGLRLSA